MSLFAMYVDQLGTSHLAEIIKNNTWALQKNIENCICQELYLLGNLAFLHSFVYFQLSSV